MNSKPTRAPGKALQSEENSLLTRFGTRMKAIALVALLSTASAFASPSKQIANGGINQPRGMVRSTVPNPVVGGPALHDYWVSDTVDGFCRIDQVPDPANPGLTHGVLNAATCYGPGIQEPADYQVETNGVNGSNGYVFVAGTAGVHRLSFIVDPADATKTVIDTANIAVFLGAGSLFTNNVTIGAPPLTLTTKLGPDGKLYVGMQNPDIWRVLNPLSPTFTPAGNKVERVGVNTAIGGNTTSMAWIGHDLWLIDVGFLNRIQNADLCFYTFPKCGSLLQFQFLSVHAGMTSDQFISTVPNGRFLYFGNGSRVVRYDTTTPGLLQVWNQSGTANGSATPQGYSLILGIGFIQTATPTALPDGSFVEDMTVVNDPVVNALFPRVPQAPPRVDAGRTWMLAANTLPTVESCVQTVGVPTPPPCVNGALGTGGTQASPNPVAAKRGILFASGLTHPRGLLFLQGNWWVSDELLGFCRIDQNPITGATSTSNCFQPDATFIPGQTAADKPNALGQQIVYVPDASGVTQNIYRFLFTPDGTGGTMALTGILTAPAKGAGGVIETVALPQGPSNDGALYIGYSNDGSVQKITNPSTAPGAPLLVVRTFNGIGVVSMAFQGNDLYMHEIGGPQISGQFIKKGTVTVLLRASPSADNGRAVPMKRAIARLQTPQIILDNPGGFAVGPATARPACLPPPGVKLSPSVPADPATTPALYLGTLGLPGGTVTNPATAVSGGLAENPEVDQYDFVCTTQVLWVNDAALDPTLSLTSPLGAVTALALSGNDGQAVLAIGDDPSVIIPNQTRQKGLLRRQGPPGTGLDNQGHVYLVF
ncbi:MAG TPA: hypothetical protein VGQ12_02380 [Candidatus Angelobacter sp.]|nr:hypothetical protein [Candidatus Angelobacter sp.]